MTPPGLIFAHDLDLDEIRVETGHLAEQSYRNDGLSRADVLWLLQTIAELLAVIEAAFSP